MKLWLEKFASPIGMLRIVSDGEVLRALDFEEYDERLRRLLGRHYGEVELSEGQAPRAVREALAAYFAGDIRAVDRLPTATGGSDFQREVWAALRRIPAGRTTSYGALAAKIGKPKAMRAVGLANGANPICIVVPCHRVIGADGSLTGYGGGLPRKRWLLAHEGIEMPARAAA